MREPVVSESGVREPVLKYLNPTTGGEQCIWLRGHFDKAGFSGGPCLLMEIEASLGSN